ncbi:glycosyltransferase [Rhodococcus sp. EPR-157]|uniref:glycosyltransferase n=1 Tax=Rhodococcus sp. EPR-157 TaxID=1813677 RepID=UPI0018D28ED6|nr:glycosyltransferase [Rhodococcus sp. EPR-157]
MRTVHNVSPHEKSASLTEGLAFKWIDAMCFDYIDLNGAVGVDSLRGNIHTILHGHYRDWYAGQHLQIDRCDHVPNRILFFGLIRPYKNVLGLIKAFREIDDEDLELRVAGGIDDDSLKGDITLAAAQDSRVSLAFGYLTDVEVVKEAQNARLIVLPYSTLFNSGVALLALSLGTPILLPAGAVADSMVKEFGSVWISQFNPPLTSEAINSARSKGIPKQRVTFGVEREWDFIGRRHSEVYISAVERRA